MAKLTNIVGMHYFIILWVGLLWTSCAAERSDQAAAEGENGEMTIPAVEVVKARFGSLPLSERLSGTVEAENQVALYPEISAPVEKVYVQNGDKVQQGDPLVKLQDDQYREQYQQAQAQYQISQARLQQAQAQLKPLESQLKRIQTLREKGLSSEQRLEMAQTEVEAARADVALAKAEVSQAHSMMQEQQNLLSKTVIRAPVSGKVGQRNAEIGMQATPDTRLFLIGNLEKLLIEVVLTAEMLDAVEIGQKARIYVKGSSPKAYVIGKVAHISPFLNEVTRSTEAEIIIDNKKGLLKPGMFVAVDILYGESRQATLLPASAIYTDPQSGETGVFVVPSLGTEVTPADTLGNPGSDELSALTQPIAVEFMPVEVLAQGAMKVGVTDIEPGQWIVTVGQHLLAEGYEEARIRITSWDRMIELQSLQQQDLLRKVLQQQTEQQQNE